MSDLIDTTQMYLRTVVELEEEGIAPMRARIAERLEQSSPTVSQTVARMERDGLLTLSDDRVIQLTDAGRAEGVRVMRRHRITECFLVDKLGVDLATVHDEACRWEHVLSAEVEEKLAHFLGDPDRSPYGNPIPGLAELGLPAAPEEFLTGVIALDDALAAGRGTGTVVRMSENVQRDRHVLDDVIAAGVVPGAAITFRADGNHIQVDGPSGTLDLGPDVAGSLYIAADA